MAVQLTKIFFKSFTSSSINDNAAVFPVPGGPLMYKLPELLVTIKSSIKICNSSNSFSLPGNFRGTLLCKAFLASWYGELNNCFEVAFDFNGLTNERLLSNVEGVLIGVFSLLFSLFGGVTASSLISSDLCLVGVVDGTRKVSDSGLGGAILFLDRLVVLRGAGLLISLFRVTLEVMVQYDIKTNLKINFLSLKH